MNTATKVTTKLTADGKHIKLYRQDCNRIRFFISTDPDTIYTSIREAWQAWDNIPDYRDMRKNRQIAKAIKKRREMKYGNKF